MDSSAFDLGDTYGSLLIGTFSGLIFYGLSLHQLFRYIRLYPSDVLSIRLIVATVMVLETLHVVITMHVCYHYLVTHYFRPQTLLRAIWTLQLIPGLTAVTACVSKTSFSGSTGLLDWTTVAMGGWYCGYPAHSRTGFILKNLLEYAHAVVGILAACEAAAALADILLASTLIIALCTQEYNNKQSWSPTYFVQTYIVKSGLLTGMCNVAALVAALVKRESLIYAAINITTSRLYANTLFAVLNSRKLMASGKLEVFANASSTDFNVIARANDIAQAERWNAPYRADPSPATIKVNVTAEKEEDNPRTRISSMVLDIKTSSLPV
ncbi:hypothetical protein BV20DRAFT_1051088 [Pilatotrama ljubarskyi]|nr:hypothetical protein BV20DRAFT_1051088 [Pilatotrama ljubarskyi]